MLLVTKQEEVEKYYKDKNYLNQSSAKNLANGLDHFLDNMDKDLSGKDFIKIGKAVDTLLTAESKDFDAEFYVSNIDFSEGTGLMAVVKSVFESLTKDNRELPLSTFTDEILAACIVHNYQNNWKTETRINKIIELGGMIFSDLGKSAGKIILTAQQYSTVKDIVKSLKESPRTMKYFDLEYFKEASDILIVYQLPLYGVLDGVKAKALLDFAIFLFNEKGEIDMVIPGDLKTRAGYTIEFPKSVRSFRYDIQAAWYTDLIADPKTKFPAEMKKYKFAKDYKVGDFHFVVESNTKPGKPLEFKLTPDALEGGRTGFRDRHSNLVSPGYKDLLKEYAYYMKNGWETDIRVPKEAIPIKIDSNGGLSC